MTIQFQPAVKTTRKLRLAFVSYEGGGKTFSSLKVGSALARPRADGTGGVALIDTEGGSAAIYAGQFAFDTLRLEQHSPESYIGALEAAEAAGYDVTIIDSLSHEWMGAGGVLELVDSLKQGGGYGWDKATPRHRKVFDAILRSKMHVIVTLRQKKAYVEETVNGRKRMREVGTEAIQREGAEYEFDIIGILDRDNNTMVVSKSRIQSVPQGTAIPKPGKEFADKLLADLNSGVAPSEAPPPTVVIAPPAPASQPAPAPAPASLPVTVPVEVQALIVRTQAARRGGTGTVTQAELDQAEAFRKALVKYGMKNWKDLWSIPSALAFKEIVEALGLRSTGDYLATDEPEPQPTLPLDAAADGFPDDPEATLERIAAAAAAPVAPTAPTLPAPPPPAAGSSEAVLTLPWRTPLVGDTYFLVEREARENGLFVVYKVREAFNEKNPIDRKKDPVKAIASAKQMADNYKTVAAAAK